MVRGLAYQSVSQSNFYSANIPGKAISVARQPSQCSIAKSMKQFHGINGLSGVPVSKGERPSRICVFRYFLKVATEMAEWIDSGRLFQRDSAQEWKALAPVLVLTLGIDRLIPLLDLSEQYGSDGASMEWR